MQRPVRGVVHQDRKAELAPAEKDDREQPRRRTLRPGREADQREADDPGMGDEPDAAPRRSAGQRRPSGAVAEAVGRPEADEIGCTCCRVTVGQLMYVQLVARTFKKKYSD